MLGPEGGDGEALWGGGVAGRGAVPGDEEGAEGLLCCGGVAGRGVVLEGAEGWAATLGAEGEGAGVLLLMLEVDS